MADVPDPVRGSDVASPWTVGSVVVNAAGTISTTVALSAPWAIAGYHVASAEVLDGTFVTIVLAREVPDDVADLAATRPAQLRCTCTGQSGTEVYNAECPVHGGRW